MPGGTAFNLLLERGANANCQDNEGRTPLHSAAYRGSISSATLSGEESPKSKTRNHTVSSASLSDDLMGETSSSSSKSCIAFDLGSGDESRSTSKDDCEDIEDDTNEDEDMNEYEDTNEYDEGGSGDDSNYNIEISHNLKGTRTYRCHGGSRSDSKGKWKPVSTKRSLSQSHGNRSNDQDDESSDQPSKRRKGLKAQVGSPSQSKRPFSCPYFKKDPFKYSDCAHWNDTNLRQVKEHCKSWHLKLWCHRCKEFQANAQNAVDRHSRYDNCQMNEETPGSAYSRNDTNSEIRDELDYPRTCTWERVFKVLFHRNTPDPYWNQPAAKAVQAYNGELSTKIRRFLAIPSDRQSEYQLGLAKSLKDRLGLDGDDVENVMVAFNEDWTAKDCNQVQISNIDGSESDPHDAAASVVMSETQSCITREQIPNITSFNDELQPTAVIVQDQQSQPNGPDPPIPQAGQGRDPSFIPLCGSHSEPAAAITTVQCYVSDFPNASGPLDMLLEAPAEEWDDFYGLSPTPTHDGPDSTTYTQ
ncbi:hypothetical protein DFP73DRAFT_555585 [Morchella snyderi]|nr:hypothetical protein DFP73DRAFT_555585 [Morchella snyderi]